MESNKLTGYVLGAAGAASYGLNPLFALPLYADGMDADSVLFLRYSFGILLVALMIVVRGRSFKVKPRQLAMFVLLGVLMALSSETLFESYNYMDAGIASTILFIYPILVALMMALFFKEKLKPLTVACLAVSLIGILLLYHKSDGSSLSLVGVGLVVVSALTYAMYIVGVNKGGLADVATLTVTFYVLVVGSLFFLARLHGGTQIILPNKWFLWGNLLALGLLPTVMSFLCTTAAIKIIGSTQTSILGSLEPVTALVVGVTVFGEVLTPRDGLGLVLILLAVTVVIAGDKVGQEFIKVRKLFPRIRRR